MGKAKAKDPTFPTAYTNPVWQQVVCICPPFNQPEPVLPESQHGADPEAHLTPASPTAAAALAVSNSFFQKSKDCAGGRDLSMPTACQASCSPWDRASAGMWLRQESPIRTQLVALGGAGHRASPGLGKAGAGPL